MGRENSTYVRVPAHLKVLRRRIRIALSSESRKIPRHQLQRFKITGITQRVLVAVSETHVRAVEAEVRQVRVPIRIAGSDRTARESRGTEVVGVVTCVRAIDVVVVGDFEGVGGRAGVDCGFVDAAEGFVCGDALADVEGVEGEVSAVVVWEESRIDGELGVFCGDAETGLDAFGERRDVCWWEVGEGGTWMTRSACMLSVELEDHSQLTIVGCGAEQYWDMGSATVALGNDKLLSVDDTAVLHDIAGNRVVVLDRLSGNRLQASNLRVNGGLVATQTSEDLLARNGVGLVHGVVRAVGGTVVSVKAEGTTSTKIALGDGTCDQILADDSGRTEKGANGSRTSATADLYGTLVS